MKLREDTLGQEKNLIQVKHSLKVVNCTGDLVLECAPFAAGIISIIHITYVFSPYTRKTTTNL